MGTENPVAHLFVGGTLKFQQHPESCWRRNNIPQGMLLPIISLVQCFNSITDHPSKIKI